MFKNLRLGGKLGVGFGMVILLAVILGAMSWMEFRKIANVWDEFETTTLSKRDSITLGFSGLQGGIHHFKNYVLRGGDYAKTFADDMSTIEKAVEGYRKIGHPSEEEGKLLEQVEQGVKSYRQAMDEAVKLREAGKSATEIDKSIKGADKELNTALNELQKIDVQETGAEAKKLKQVIADSTLLILILCLVILFSGIAIAWAITRAITRPLAEAVTVANSLAEGDLKVKIMVESRDETGQLLQAMQNMVTKLSEMRSSARCAAVRTRWRALRKRSAPRRNHCRRHQANRQPASKKRLPPSNR